MSLVELMMLFASIKAKDFQERSSVGNLTAWCDATQLIDDPLVMEETKRTNMSRARARRKQYA